MLGTLDKFEDIMNFVAHRNLLGNLNDCIFKAEVARVDDAVSISNVAYDAICYFDVLQHYCINSMVRSRIATQMT